MKFSRIQDYLSEFVYGGIDGSVTTFAVVAGAAGAALDSSIVIILGISNLIADGFSMSVGSYLANKSEHHNYEKYKRQEYWEVQYNPEEGRQEIRQIYERKGFQNEALEMVVETITANKDTWVDTMMKEELVMFPNGRSPVSRAGVTFISFFLVGAVPLLTYVLDYVGSFPFDLFVSSCVLTGAAFLIIGWLKSYVGEKAIWKGMAETLFLGGVAATLAYFAGSFLKNML